MTNETLAHYSNLALYSAMFVFTAAMVSFALDLAGTAPVASDARLRSRQQGARQLVTAGAGSSAVSGSSAMSGSSAVSGGRATSGGARTAGDVAADGERGGDALPRRRQAAGIAMALFRLATALLAVSVLLRGMSVARVPWGNMFEFSTTGALAVSVSFVVLSLRRDVRWLGLFVAGPVLLTLGLALAVFYTEASELMPSLKSIWLVIHVSVAILSVALFTLAFSVVILSLVKARWESSDEPLTGARARVSAALPDARFLDRTAYGMHVLAFPMWTFTLIAGAIWAEQAWGHYWNWDPKEVWTFVIWVVYAAYLHARATSGWSTRRANYLALGGYACVIVNFAVVNVYFVGQHSYSGL